MKRIIPVLLAVSVWFLLSSFSLLEYEWKTQNLFFSLPDHFVQESSTDFEFVATGDGMSFQMNVYMESLIMENELESFVGQQSAETYGITASNGSGDLGGNGFTGHYVYGEADGKLVYVLGLLDLNSGISYLGKIAYNSSLENADQKIADQILKSIVKR